MLTTSAAFDAAIDANTTEVDAKVRLWREINAVAPSITVDSDYDGIEERFGPANVTKIRNPMENGIAYGPSSEFFTTSSPERAFRFIQTEDFDDYSDRQYYIPVDTGTTELADFTVDYLKDYDINAIQIRYENSRTASTFYDSTIQVYVTPDGGGESLVFTGTMNTNGVSTVVWDGASWDEGNTVGSDVQAVRSIRFRIIENSYNHQPRIMYAGGLQVVDVDDDIINVRVKKNEFEQSAYLPYGEPSGNSCDVELDNTQQSYRYGPSITEDFLLKGQKFTVQFGVNTKYGGGADSFEYVNAGTFYVDSFNYDEEDMTVSLSGQDLSKILQERMCGNALWRDKSLKYIVWDVLSRVGISPSKVVFKFGVSGNANQNNKRTYTWSTDEQTVWDFLSTLAKSELGTVYIDENDNIVFTDRLQIENSYDAGSQYAIGDNVNLESLNEQFEVLANKVRISYEELTANSTKFNPQLIYDAQEEVRYVNGDEQFLNQVLWQPDDDESYLGSATLYRTLKPNDTYVYITSDSAVQITRDTGEVLIGDEFITYSDRTVLGSGQVRLKIEKRNNRNTVYNQVVPTHRGVNANYRTRSTDYWDRTLFVSNTRPNRARRRNTGDGFRISTVQGQKRYSRVLYLTSFDRHTMNSNTNYRIYQTRFRFNKLPDAAEQHQAAGLFINQSVSGRALFFEISNPSKKGFVVPNRPGNCRAYKSSRYVENLVPMPPAVEVGVNNYGTDVQYVEASEKNDGTYVDLAVIQNGKTIDWYVNGEHMGNFQTDYTHTYLRSLGYNKSQRIVGSTNTNKGPFGFFTRGSTDVTVDFIYASDDTSLGPDVIDNSRGFYKYFDKASQSWGTKDGLYGKGREYYIEFGAPVHEVLDLKSDHDAFPNLIARTFNSDEENVTVYKQSHTPFDSRILVANSSRIGIQLNSTVFYQDGSKLDQRFFVYGVSVVKSEEDEIETVDGPSVRRYGLEEVEFTNPWVNSKKKAISLANYVRKFWSKPQRFFEVNIFPNPALQVGDRVSLTYTDKGFDGSDVWFVSGITIDYDGGLSGSLLLKRFENFPTANVDYRNDGGINVT